MDMLAERMGDWELDRKQSTQDKLIYQREFQRIKAEVILEQEGELWRPRMLYLSKHNFQINGTLHFQATRSVKLAFEGASTLAEHFANDFAGRWF